MRCQDIQEGQFILLVGMMGDRRVMILVKSMSCRRMSIKSFLIWKREGGSIVQRSLMNQSFMSSEVLISLPLSDGIMRSRC